MAKFNFDEIINRKNTYSLKWDFNKERNHDEDELSMWVADMDFKLPDDVINPLISKVNEGIFGYSDVKDDLLESISNWYLKSYNTKVDKLSIIINPSVVFSICSLIRILTKENDYIIINEPVYYPFKESIILNNRKAISSDLIIEDNKYVIDFEDFENKIKKYNVKLYILCSPHNPVGRVWDKEELLRIIDICNKNNVKIISDEIHADFCYNKKFTSILALDDNAIVVNAPTKSFNIPAFKISYAIINDKNIYNEYKKELDRVGYSQQSIMGIIATIAAYNNGRLWLEEVKKYIWNNILYIKSFIVEKLPKIKFIVPEGTYLIWLDFREYKLKNNELRDLMKKAKLWLDDGFIFGRAGEGFERINVATNRSNIDKMLNSLYGAINNLK